MNRALRAATMGVLLLSPVLLTACSAGQVTQTASQDRDKVGGSALVGEITLREVVLVYPEEGEGRYAPGDDAELSLAVVNGGVEDDTLVSIEGEGFDGVFVGEPPDESPASPTTAAPSTPTGSPGATPSATPSPTQAAPTADTEVDIPVPAGEILLIGPPLEGSGSSSGGGVEGEGVRIFLADLADELTVGHTIELTLTFEEAGSVTVTALVATPDEALERDENEAFDYHQEEHAEAPDPGEAAEDDAAAHD